MTSSIVRSSFLAIFSMLMASSVDCTQPFGRSVKNAYAGNVDHYVRLNNQRNAARGFEVKGKNLHRQNIGKRTVAEIKRILKTGKYTGDGHFAPVNVSPADYREVHVYDSLNGGIGEVARATNMPMAIQPLVNPDFETEYSFVRENSGEAAVDFYYPDNNGKIAVLNFGNAIKRCGGFLNGKGAQEESLSRISLLSASLMRIAADDMYYAYNENLLEGGEMSERVVVTPNSLIFRTDNVDANWRWLENPVPVSIVTASAFDKKQYNDIQEGLPEGIRHNVPSAADIEENTMTLIRNSLLAAAHNGCETFVLGAFGCGVCAYGEDDKDAVYRRIAKCFKRVLIDEGLDGYFKKIVFPIVDDNIRRTFKGKFRRAGAMVTNSRVFGQN